MAEEKKDQGFTKEQLEELRIDSALGGDIPFVGIAGVIGRKTVPHLMEAGKKVFTEVYEHYVEGKVAKEAAKAASLQELRASMRPLEDIFKQGIEEGKLNPKSLEGKTKGADLFAKNEDDLRHYLSADDFRNYAKLAIQDEKIYRETLSPPVKFLRAFHYDNANPELGYAMGPVRYGGTYNTHLAVSAADTELQEMGIMVLNNLRGAAQTVATGVVGVKVAVGAPVDEMASNNVPVKSQALNGEQSLQVALKLAPELKDAAQQSLNQIQRDYVNLQPAEATKYANQDAYMDAAKRSIAKEILTDKLEPHAEVNEKRSSLDGLSVEQKVALIDQHISKLPEHQQAAMRETVANNLNSNGVRIEESGVNQQQIEKV